VTSGPLIKALPVRADGRQRGYGADDAGNEEGVANTDTTNTTTMGDSYAFYAPGTGALRFKPGLVKIMRTDDFLHWNLHYNATGRPEKDRHSGRLWFTTNATHLVKSGIANDNNLYEGQELLGRNVTRPNIPAYAENYRVASLRAIQSD